MKEKELEGVIIYLKSLDREHWYDIFDRILKYNSLPLPLIFIKETAALYLIYLNESIIGSKSVDLLKIFHSSLIEYYFTLTPCSNNSESIYDLHYVFSAIRPKVNITERLENQFTSEKLLDQYYQNISLHSSLLDVINVLEVINKDRIKNYLHQKFNISSSAHSKLEKFKDYILQIFNPRCDYSFIRVSLRFFINNASLTEYFFAFEKLSKLNVKESNRLQKVLANSLIELRDNLGSFYEVYLWLEQYMQNNFNHEVSSYNFLVEISKSLKYDKDLFAGDIYAKLIKCLINERNYILPPKLIVDIIREAEQFEINSKLIVLRHLKNYIRANVSRYNYNQHGIHLDEFSDENFTKIYYFHAYPEIKSDIYSFEFSLSNNVLFLQKISKEEFDIISTFINMRYDELAKIESETSTVCSVDVPLFAKLSIA